MDASEICSLLDADLVNFIHNVITLLKILVPVVLVIFGMIDFVKGVMAGKEDEIKKGQQVFIKRLFAGFLVFFVVSIVQLVMSVVSPDDDSIWTCADQILNGNVNAIKHTSSSDSSLCNGPIKEYDYEYQYCLSKSGNQICNTIFQNACSIGSSTVLWEYNAIGDMDAVIGDYTCKGYLNNTETVYKRALYSCTVDANNGFSLEECASKLSSFCTKK